MKRIAIFQYDWPIQSYSRDLATIFKEYGYEVDFFGYNLELGKYITVKSFQDQNIFIREFEAMKLVYAKEGNLYTKLRHQLIFRNYKQKTNTLFDADRIKIDRKVLLDSYRHIKKQDYDLCIGIEKQGLIWSGLIGQKLNIPFIYYSLELYIEDHPIMQTQAYLRDFEKYFHQYTCATIIQDPFRKEALFKANGVSNQPIYLPVSIPGPINKQPSNFLRDRFHISKDKTILLFFGGMAPQRFCEEIVETAQQLKEDYVVVFHGFEMQEGYLNKLKSLDLNHRIVFSLDLIPEDELGALISSADIGFAIYSNDNANDRLTAFSSQKIALFLKHGLPIITNANASYTALFNEFKCGIAVANYQDMPLAIGIIGTDLSTYQSQAYKAFDKYFNIDHLKAGVMDSIDQILK